MAISMNSKQKVGQGQFDVASRRDRMPILPTLLLDQVRRIGDLEKRVSIASKTLAKWRCNIRFPSDGNLYPSKAIASILRPDLKICMHETRAHACLGRKSTAHPCNHCAWKILWSLSFSIEIIIGRPFSSGNVYFFCPLRLMPS